MQLKSDLKQKNAVSCEKGIVSLKSGAYGAFLRKELIGWIVIDAKILEKKYKFKNFKEALVFVNKVGGLAEKEGHHPDILLYGWNKVKIDLTTHAIDGLSENDFILASRIDNKS